MGEKYSREKLDAMRSIGFVRGGRTRHTSAGSVVEDVRESRGEDGKLIRETTDTNGSVITEHQDGRQDVDVHAKPVVVDLTLGSN